MYLIDQNTVTIQPLCLQHNIMIQKISFF